MSPPRIIAAICWVSAMNRSDSVWAVVGPFEDITVWKFDTSSGVDLNKIREMGLNRNELNTHRSLIHSLWLIYFPEVNLDLAVQIIAFGWDIDYIFVEIKSCCSDVGPRNRWVPGRYKCKIAHFGPREPIEKEIRKFRWRSSVGSSDDDRGVVCNRACYHTQCLHLALSSEFLCSQVLSS